MADTATPFSAAAVLARRGFGWLEDSLNEFMLAPEVTPDELNLARNLKPLSELALLGAIAGREGATGSDAARIAAALPTFGWRQLRAGELLYDVQRDQPFGPSVIGHYAMFVRAGYRHLGLDTFLTRQRSLLASQVPDQAPPLDARPGRRRTRRRDPRGPRHR